MLSKFWAKIRPVVQFRVRRWHIAMRGAKVLVVCENDIWYWALLLFLAWDCATCVCEWLHGVKLPKRLRNWTRRWGGDRDSAPCLFEEYYGDDLSVFWHVWVESPLCQFAWNHRNYAGDIDIELTIDEARQKLSPDLDCWEWIERELERQKQWEAEEKAEKAGE